MSGGSRESRRRRRAYGRARLVLASLALASCSGLAGPPSSSRISHPRPQRSAPGADAGLRAELARLEAELDQIASENQQLRAYLARAADLYGGEERERAERYRREAERLRADLAQAEESFVAIETGLRESYTRAEAVSGLAEARVRVERAVPLAGEGSSEIAEAKRKLDEAERQLKAENFASSIFFASRARRLADALLRETAPAPPASAPQDP